MVFESFSHPCTTTLAPSHYYMINATQVNSGLGALWMFLFLSFKWQMGLNGLVFAQMIWGSFSTKLANQQTLIIFTQR